MKAPERLQLPPQAPDDQRKISNRVRQRLEALVLLGQDSDFLSIVASLFGRAEIAANLSDRGLSDPNFAWVREVMVRNFLSIAIPDELKALLPYSKLKSARTVYDLLVAASAERKIKAVLKDPAADNHQLLFHFFTELFMPLYKDGMISMLITLLNNYGYENSHLVTKLKTVHKLPNTAAIVEFLTVFFENLLFSLVDENEQNRHQALKTFNHATSILSDPSFGRYLFVDALLKRLYRQGVNYVDFVSKLQDLVEAGATELEPWLAEFAFRPVGESRPLNPISNFRHVCMLYPEQLNHHFQGGDFTYLMPRLDYSSVEFLAIMPKLLANQGREILIADSVLRNFINGAFGLDVCAATLLLDMPAKQITAKLIMPNLYPKNQGGDPSFFHLTLVIDLSGPTPECYPNFLDATDLNDFTLKRLLSVVFGILIKLDEELDLKQATTAAPLKTPLKAAQIYSDPRTKGLAHSPKGAAKRPTNGHQVLGDEYNNTKADDQLLTQLAKNIQEKTRLAHLLANLELAPEMTDAYIKAKGFNLVAVQAKIAYAKARGGIVKQLAESTVDGQPLITIRIGAGRIMVRVEAAVLNSAGVEIKPARAVAYDILQRQEFDTWLKTRAVKQFKK